MQNQLVTQNNNLYESKQIESNHLSFSLNEDNHTACLSNNQKLEGDICIPRSINIGSKEYVVTSIGEDCFKSSNISSVTFPEDSQLQIIESGAFKYCNFTHIFLPDSLEQICFDTFTYSHIQKVEFTKKSKLRIIERYAFFNSQLESLSIPSNFIDFQVGCLSYTKKLNEIKILQNDENVLINYDNKYVIGKSDPKSDKYDVLLFANKDIEIATIPSFIKKIGSNCFENCQNLKKVEFSEDSELELIDFYSFGNSSIENIFIPSHVKEIGKLAFSEGKQLKKIEFAKNSELETINDYAFQFHQR